MAVTERKMNDKLEALQYVAPDADVIAIGSAAYVARREQALAEIAKDLGHDWHLADMIRRYISAVENYGKSGAWVGLKRLLTRQCTPQARWQTLNAIALKLDDALDAVEDRLGMDIRLGEIDDDPHRKSIYGASKTDPTRQGEVELFAPDLERLLSDQLFKRIVIIP